MDIPRDPSGSGKGMTDKDKLAGLSLGEALPFFEKSRAGTEISVARNAVGECPLAGSLDWDSPCVRLGRAACERGLVPRIVRVAQEKGRTVVTAACFVPPAEKPGEDR